MRNQLWFLRHRNVVELDAGRFHAYVRGLVGHAQRVANDIQRIGAHVLVRQLGLHHHFHVARIANIDAGKILGGGFMRDPQDPPAVRSELQVDALAQPTKTVEFVLPEMLEIPDQGICGAGAPREIRFCVHRDSRRWLQDMLRS